MLCPVSRTAQFGTAGQANVLNFHCAKGNVNKDPYFRFSPLTQSDKLLICDACKAVTLAEEATTFVKTK